MTSIRLTGLRADSPAAALALYGIARLLAGDATVGWQADGRGGWSAEVRTGVAQDKPGLAEVLASRVAADPLASAPALAKDVNELEPQTWREAVDLGSPALAWLVLGLAAERPLRTAGRVSLTPACVYSFGTRGTLFGNAAKADTNLAMKDLQQVLSGPWTRKKGENTLGVDPGARRQDGAIIGPDPSADGVRGVPGLLPLVLRGLSAVVPMPGPRAVSGGAFGHGGGRSELRWPVFTASLPAEAIPLMAGRDWLARDPAARRAASVDAVFASQILREERRLSHGRRVA